MTEGVRVVDIDTEWLCARIVDGVVEIWEPRTPVPARPPLPIPDGFSPEQERQAAKQGGCCGQPSAAS